MKIEIVEVSVNCEFECQISLILYFFGPCQTNILMQVLIKEPSEHSHASEPDRLHVIRLKNEIKLRGTSSDEGASTIFLMYYVQLH